MSCSNWLYGYLLEPDQFFTYARTTPGFLIELGGKTVDPEAYVLDSPAYKAVWTQEAERPDDHHDALFNQVREGLKQHGAQMGLVYRDARTNDRTGIAYFHRHCIEDTRQDTAAHLKQVLEGYPRPSAPHDLLGQRLGFPADQEPEWYQEHDGSRDRDIVVQLSVSVLCRRTEIIQNQCRPEEEEEEGSSGRQGGGTKG
ncbi:hypothetical protein OH76DRAFT_1480826 [Lentinus brumalis]|uniref:Uncharacterized protein n=1 Tax=Lentinus brumalis TaxID=2498619 RepID=A0A371DI66_9APHY|nr:hypothetical protein OH76DRAFT_1480826 [Polyporus brumalis]